MDSIVAPLCSALVMTAGATVGLSGEALKGALRGLAGNLAAGLMDTSTRRIIARLSDKSVDSTTGLPRNHDVQRASADALRGAATALLLATAAEVDPKKPWMPALLEACRQGRWARELRVRAFERHDLAWLGRAQAAVEGEAFVTWHEQLSLGEADIRACFNGDRFSLSRVLPGRFHRWLLGTIGAEGMPGAFERLLDRGWAVPGSVETTLLFEDVYCLFFREFLKQRPEVFRIIVADQVTALDTRARDLQAQLTSVDHALADFVSHADGLFAEQRQVLFELRSGQREIADRQADVMLELLVLSIEVREGNAAAAAALSDVCSRIQLLTKAFTGLERKLFGLPLIVPRVPPRPEHDASGLWIIQAKYRALDLIGRDQELDNLKAWVQGAAPVSLRMITGVAGAGKTRIAYELMWWLAAAGTAEWDVGRIDHLALRKLADRGAGEISWERPTLLVVDSARAAGESLEHLITELARRADEEGLPKFRLLLLERLQSATQDWIDQLGLLESPDGGSSAAALFAPREPIVLGPLPEGNLRRTLFVAALTKLGVTQVPVPELGESAELEKMLDHPDWSQPLVPVMAALVVQAQGSIEAVKHSSRLDLAAILARSELERVSAFGQRSPSQPEHQHRLLLHVAGLTALCGELAISELRELVASESTALGIDCPGGPGVLAEALAQAWGGAADKVVRPQPDLVAEAIVLSALAPRPRDLQDSTAAILRHVAGREASACGLLVRAIHSYHEDAKQSATLNHWVEALVAHAIATSPTLLASLDDAIPINTEVLRSVGMRVAEARYAHLQSSTEGNARLRAHRAWHAGFRYLRSGRADMAIPRLEESLSIQEKLAGSFVGGVARAAGVAQLDVDRLRSLVTLVASYNDVGRFDDALRRSAEAVTLCETLAVNPKYRPHLSDTLATRASVLGRVGRHLDALQATEASLRVARQSAEAEPGVFDAQLALALTNHVFVLANLGRKQEALAPAEEAVRIRRRLVAANPGAYREDLAIALNNLANRYAEVGRLPDAISVGEEAVVLSRAFSKANPDAAHGLLSLVLRTLSMRYAEAKRPAEALQLAEEGVAVVRGAFAKAPAAFRRPLAQALNSLAVRYTEVGRLDGAISQVEEALLIHDVPVDSLPDALDAEGAMMLANLARFRQKAGHAAEAVAPARAACAFFRHHPTAQTARVSMQAALTALAHSCGTLERYPEAIEAGLELLTFARAMAAGGNPQGLSVLVVWLNAVAWFQHLAGAPEDGVRHAEEAVELGRAMLAKDPSIASDFKQLLDTLAACCEDLGWLERAATARSEAAQLG